jgi:hypothetical protein
MMHNKFCLCVNLILIIFSHNLISNNLSNSNPTSYVQVEYSQGRFGDNLIAFAHGLYFAKKYNYQLLLPAFQYSENLKFSALLNSNSSNLISANLDTTNLRKVTVDRIYSDTLFKNINCATLFIVPYFPETFMEQVAGRSRVPYFMIDWDDPEFKQQLRDLIAPKTQLALIQPPVSKISIALHLRNGGNFDHVKSLQSSDLGLYKIPVLEYYINQIRLASELLNHAPIYLFVFTDGLDAVKLTRELATKVDLANIEFACREQNTSDTCYVLEDFFSIPKFDILIRPDSNFSIMAEKLGDFTFVISPGTLILGTKIQRGIVTLKKSITEQLAKF